LAALLLAKSPEAAERGATLVLSDDSAVREGAIGDPRDAVLVVGNLVANAIDALDGAAGTIEVSVRTDADGLHVRVGDSGPGIAADLVDEVFREGFTTKAAQSGPRGLGLALTRQACLRRGGWVRVRNADGAVFTALLPEPARRRADEPESARRRADELESARRRADEPRREPVR
ncbi:sensor histidine kinase, partial [Nonomuraea rhizosphaerae]|uniref:sensor histidine kinase n=1 Tax=Nonomuraea rhizosphaerae TaxID=2665663 RepID=UPI001FED21DF